MNYSAIASPCFVIEENLLRSNLSTIREISEKSGVEIILAFKGFAMWGIFPVIREYISGAAASSVSEAKLCFEEMKTKAHTYCVAINPAEFEEIASYSSHVTFNTLSQFKKYGKKAIAKGISCGIRVNPEYSEIKTDLYNPASPHSRLGLTADHFEDKLPSGIEGLHFHTLFEDDSYTLEHTLASFENKFGHLISQAKWVNMGGGHLVTRKGYDIEHLVNILKKFREKYQVMVILEPGSAFAWQAGVLISTVLDVIENHGVKTAILDVSFAAHMPDCLEMPYRPEIEGAGDPVPGGFNYRIGGLSCLAGDFMTEYSFGKELKEGDIIIFKDMIHYTMVKTNMFNGVNHPSIGIWTKDDEFKLFRSFSYEDYKNRLC